MPRGQGCKGQSLASEHGPTRGPVGRGSGTWDHVALAELWSPQMPLPAVSSAPAQGRLDPSSQETPSHSAGPPMGLPSPTFPASELSACWAWGHAQSPASGGGKQSVRKTLLQRQATLRSASRREVKTPARCQVKPERLQAAGSRPCPQPVATSALGGAGGGWEHRDGSEVRGVVLKVLDGAGTTGGQEGSVIAEAAIRREGVEARGCPPCFLLWEDRRRTRAHSLQTARALHRGISGTPGHPSLSLCWSSMCRAYPGAGPADLGREACPEPALGG
uniref:Uncharacterized protein n=1 Tax=Rangifer tarandus platyrhynchus TaxID=3082113 RepID=A0ACB0FFA8_RANTA|nr:unnamed protein product [Rangifer tarandus platyrhynchus]